MTDGRMRDEVGFTLVEVMVAMAIIAIVVTTLVALQLSSLKTITLAKQRDQATSMANQQIEALRSLPFDKLAAGLLASDAGTDTAWVAGGRLMGPWNEKLVTSTSQTEPTLNPHVTTKTVGTQNYTVRSFVTSPKDAAGVDLTSSADFWLTTVVEWSSSVTGGATKQVTVRNREVFPAGCQGDATHPYVGPCQAFFYGSAGWSGGGIKVLSADATDGLFSGSGTSSADIILPGLSSSYSVEQTTSALSKATTSGTSVNGVSTGVVSNAAQASIDVATGTPRESGWLTVAQSTTAQTVAGTAGTVTLSASPSDTGGNGAATKATTFSACKDLAGNVLVDDSVPPAEVDACASSTITPGGASSAQVALKAIGGRSLDAFNLATVDASGTAAQAYTTRLLAPIFGHCTGTSGAGCSASGATRAISAVRAGDLPARQSGDEVSVNGVATTGFDGAVKLTGLTERATGEIGVGLTTGTLPVTNRFEVTRTGTMQIWNGTGYTSVALSNTALNGVYTIPTTKAVYQAAGKPDISVVLDGKVTQAAAQGPTRNVPANCQPDACTGTSVGAGISMSLTYTVFWQTTQIAHFTTQVDLGTVRAGTTYRAMP